MKRKGMLPKHTLGYFDQTPENLNYLLHATEQQSFKEWHCPECGITVYGVQKLMLEHSKIHNNKRELRENETKQTNFKLY